VIILFPFLCFFLVIVILIIVVIVLITIVYNYHRWPAMVAAFWQPAIVFMCLCTVFIVDIANKILSLSIHY